MLEEKYEERFVSGNSALKYSPDVDSFRIEQFLDH